MPQAIPFIIAGAAIIGAGTAVYGAVAGDAARSAQEKALRERLAQEGIVTGAEKKLKELQIAQIERSLFGPSNQPPVKRKVRA